MKKYFQNMFDIDAAVGSVLASKVSNLVSGPVILIFIVLFLTPEQQGVWFTFISLAAMSLLAELGFTIIVTQFVSHEFSDLRLAGGFILGKRKNRDRLFSLAKYSLKIYSIVLPLATIFMTVVGFYILNDQSFYTKIAWFLYSVTSTLRLFLSLLQSIYQGVDCVVHVYRERTIGTIVLSIFTLIFLSVGLQIWSLVLASFISTSVMIWSLYSHGHRFWHQMARHKESSKHSWFKEIVNLQLKYAVSWASGYLIAHLFVPVTYKVFGAEVAGQFGLAIALLSAITQISVSWVDARIPKFNMFVAKRRKHDLDSLFVRSIFRGYISFILGIISVLVVVYLANTYEIYQDRFLSLYLMFLFTVVHLAKINIIFLAKYLRAHKSEPFYMLSLLSALFVTMTVFGILPTYGMENFFYILILIHWAIILPLAVFIAMKFVKNYYQ